SGNGRSGPSSTASGPTRRSPSCDGSPRTIPSSGSPTNLAERVLLDRLVDERPLRLGVRQRFEDVDRHPFVGVEAAAEVLDESLFEHGVVADPRHRAGLDRVHPRNRHSVRNRSNTQTRVGSTAMEAAAAPRAQWTFAQWGIVVLATIQLAWA